MKFMKGFITVLALGLVAFVVTGLLLPGTWSTERERTIAAPAQEIYPYLVDLAEWSEWSSVGQVEGTLSDPSRGPGANLTWDDPQWGQGRFELVSSTPGRTVEYRVTVEDDAMETGGRIELIPTTGGTRVRWREEGDFGWNPLLAYFALGMDRMQGRELEKSLDRLQELVER